VKHGADTAGNETGDAGFGKRRFSGTKIASHQAMLVRGANEKTTVTMLATVGEGSVEWRVEGGGDDAMGIGARRLFWHYRGRRELECGWTRGDVGGELSDWLVRGTISWAGLFEGWFGDSSVERRGVLS